MFHQNLAFRFLAACPGWNIIWQFVETHFHPGNPEFYGYKLTSVITLRTVRFSARSFCAPRNVLRNSVGQFLKDSSWSNGV